MGSERCASSGVQGQSTWLGVRDEAPEAEAPEAESILAFICLMESENLALVRDFSIYYYIVVASLSEEV